jgi:hypothetical protein
MQASSVTSNIIRTAYNSNSMHILTDWSNSLFDHYISNLDNLLAFPIDNKNYNSSISYDIICSNDPIRASSQNRDLSSLHVNTLLYFHTMCPNNFKKEDKFLLKNTINTCYKIFTNNDCMKTWGFDKTEDRCHILNYGISASDIGDIQKTRTVILLNFNNNPSINSLFRYVQNIFTDAIMLTSIRDTNVINDLKQSVVCIETESYYNIIKAISCQCYVISALDYISEDGLFSIASYDLIIDEIKKMLSIYDIETAKKYSNTILKKYSDTKFQQTFMNIMKQIKQEPYIWRE